MVSISQMGRQGSSTAMEEVDTQTEAATSRIILNRPGGGRERGRERGREGGQKVVPRAAIGKGRAPVLQEGGDASGLAWLGLHLPGQGQQQHLAGDMRQGTGCRGQEAGDRKQGRGGPRAETPE